jgi:hypothetical protein
MTTDYHAVMYQFPNSSYKYRRNRKKVKKYNYLFNIILQVVNERVKRAGHIHTACAYVESVAQSIAKQLQKAIATEGHLPR